MGETGPRTLRGADVICPLCNEPVNLREPSNYHEETGWVQRRHDGGTHGLSLRVETGRMAHAVCVNLARKGVAIGQERLL